MLTQATGYTDSSRLETHKEPKSLSKGIVDQVGNINVDTEYGGLLVNAETIEDLTQAIYNQTKFGV